MSNGTQREEPITIFWFRRDLRLEDNPALLGALASGKTVLPIFIFDITEMKSIQESLSTREKADEVNAAVVREGGGDYDVNQALKDLEANRIGFCVLHPAGSLAGRPCTIEKVDGTTEEGSFPDLIAPHQPFFDIRPTVSITSSRRTRFPFEPTYGR